MASSEKNPSLVVACLLLTFVTLACYSSVVSCGFVSYDDPGYVTLNPHVTNGLTLDGLVWALSSGLLCNWHPLTWLSHMLDCQLFGLWAGGHHLTNLLLHTVNTVLLFGLLRRMTGALWRSAMVAGLFALHPLHVESVAWISERKDVLSTLFWLLTVLMYARYVEESGVRSSKSQVSGLGSKAWYGLALSFFALGLMSKPMVVTLPFVLLLLDWWPLNRVSSLKFQVSSEPAANTPSSLSPFSVLLSPTLWRLVWEKFPFFVLIAISSVVTYFVQKEGGAVWSLNELTFTGRIENGLVSYARYLGKTLWPVGLALPYPRRDCWPLGQVMLAGALVAGMFGVAVWLRRKHPYVLVGWCWFLGVLIPVIGLVQVGSQSMADRYTYVPLIGVFIMLVWGTGEVLRRWRVPNMAMGLAAVLILTACYARTSDQLHHWNNGETLFRHSLAVTENNYFANFSLGNALDDAGRTDEALPFYFKAVEIDPHNPEGQFNLGTALMKAGLLDDAAAHLAAAVTNNPNFARAHINLGSVLFKQGQLDEAAVHYSKGVALKPDDPQAQYNLGTFLLAQSKIEEAVKHLSEAARLQPDNAEFHANLAMALVRQGRASEAIAHFTETMRLKPNDPESLFNLGLALLEQGKPREAALQFVKALRLRPAEAKTHFRLGQALEQQHEPAEAVAHYREAIRLRENYPGALNRLAWILSSDPDPKLRAGEEAVRFAQRACELTRYEHASIVLTMAAAHAEAGQFPEAIANAQKARDLAMAAGQKDVAAKAEELLNLFQSNLPFRETD